MIFFFTRTRTKTRIPFIHVTDGSKFQTLKTKDDGVHDVSTYYRLVFLMAVTSKRWLVVKSVNQVTDVQSLSGLLNSLKDVVHQRFELTDGDLGFMSEQATECLQTKHCVTSVESLGSVAFLYPDWMWQIRCSAVKMRRQTCLMLMFNSCTELDIWQVGPDFCKKISVCMFPCWVLCSALNGARGDNASNIPMLDNVGWVE